MRGKAERAKTEGIELHFKFLRKLEIIFFKGNIVHHLENKNVISNIWILPFSTAIKMVYNSLSEPNARFETEF